MKKTIVTILILALAATSSATIINIPDDYPAIQQGIDATADGDTVLVQPGTYYESVTFNGHNVVLGSWFLTTGDTSFISQTIIDASSNPTTEGAVNFVTGEDSTSRITGITITFPSGGGITTVFCNGSSPIIDHNIIRDSFLIGQGAGICCKNYAGPVIAYNLIIDNENYESNAQGGGVFCSSQSNPVIIGNIISGNFAVDGGGIYCLGCSGIKILNNTIMDNGAAWTGGGIFCVSSDAEISGNKIIDNYGVFMGGGVFCGGPGQVILSDNIIAGNYGYEGIGGGIYSRATDPLIINNTIFGNIADSVGAGLYCRSSNPILINNIFFADSIGWPDPMDANEIFADSSWPVVEYCDIQGGWPGTGNIDIDPLFRNSAGGDFHLMSMICGDTLDSPCIDAGSPHYSDSLLDCTWGLGTTASDMGAYGGGDTAYVGISDVPSSLPERFMLLQNYPNPFNAQTTIRFIVPKSGNIQLTIYDLLGRQIDILVDEYTQTGMHKITFDASSLSSGVYFCRLRAGDAVETKRMVLLK